jgi:hypothetical protein
MVFPIRAKAICFALFLFFSSCNLTLETRFNADWSGKIRLHVSYHVMKSMMANLDTANSSLTEFFNPEEIESIQTELSYIKGVSDVKVINDVDEGSVVVSAQFKELESLNLIFENFFVKLLENKDEDVLYKADNRYFSLKSKKVLVYEHPANFQKVSADFTGLFVLSFPKKIRNISHVSAVLSSDKTQATLNLDSLQKGEIVIIKL